MNKNSTKLNRRLKSYSALAGTLVAGTVADAQVMYTDISPDSNLTTGFAYPLDLDNNAAVDFILQVSEGTYTYGTTQIFYDYGLIAPNVAGNAIDTAAAGGPMMHAANDAISSSLLWDANSSYQLLGLAFAPPFTPYNTGNFLGTGDGYIGLKFMIATATHYGWVRVNLAADATTMLIKDYGYNATANTQILAGATGVGIISSALNEVAVFSNGSMITINRGELENASYIVRDVTGREITSGNLFESTSRIDLNGNAEGVYLVTILSEGNQITKKVSIR